MFARVFAVASLAALAVANPLAVRGGESKCNNGQIQCCQQTQQASSFLSGFNNNVLASVAASVEGLVGVQCSPISVIGGGAACQANQQAVCCEGNTFNGLVNLGCSNVNL
ncbi:hypothetical protein SCLCIDRAFT_1212962 [Scleroderma citrinum Foug A]|uniref:Hydrophobin n=1 Tax=Scleroderma citrinum Foug A TaxID=1036808 RepID=A0A0C3DWB2_9AGAM|nr:hypothetical protein SCLCIDRAFT_1212962 [Scleroderma citrinum Foug A]